MVDRISQRVTRLQNDFKKVSAHKISAADVDALIHRAKRDGFTESEAKAMKQEIKRYESSFTPGAKTKIDAFMKTVHKFTAFDVQKHQPGLLPDPSALKGDQKLLNQMEVKGGQLFISGVKGDDAEQQYLGDCYLMAAMSAVAHASPKDIQDSFKKNKDGTYDVRIFVPKGEKFEPTWVTVDTDLPQDVSGKLNYAKGHDSKELWPALLEKAYATKAGSYAKIEGGVPGDAMSAMTGKPSIALPMKGPGVTPEGIFKAITEGSNAGKPMTAATKYESAEAQYTNTGMYTDHTYTIFGTSVEKGEKYIQLRNPWGSGEPAKNGKDDGIFKIPFKQFLELFPDVAING